MTEKTDLDHIAERIRPTKITHDYFRYYWIHFGNRRHTVRSLLEIGVQSGRSLKVWREFFPNATICGLDYDPGCARLNADGFAVEIGDSRNPAVARAALERFGRTSFDIIIDDGAHHPQAQIGTFRTWFPHLAEGGVYVVEDVAQFSRYDRVDALDAFSELIYGINHVPDGSTDWHALTTLEGVANPFVRQIVGISFYRYLIFIEKGRNPEDNRYLTDPAFNRLDLEAQREAGGTAPPTPSDWRGWRNLSAHLGRRLGSSFIPRDIRRPRLCGSLLRAVARRLGL